MGDGAGLASPADPAKEVACWDSSCLELAGSGVVVGMLAAASTKLLNRFVFGVGPLDPPTFAFIAALFTVLGAVARYVPAARASGVAPSEALRAD